MIWIVLISIIARFFYSAWDWVQPPSTGQSDLWGAGLYGLLWQGLHYNPFALIAVNSLLGCVMACCVYRLGKRYYAQSLAFAMAFLFAVLPDVIWLEHHTLPVSLVSTLLALFLIQQGEKSRFILAGLMSLFSPFFAVLPLSYAPLQSRRDLLVSLALLLGAVLLACCLDPGQWVGLPLDQGLASVGAWFFAPFPTDMELMWWSGLLLFGGMGAWCLWEALEVRPLVLITASLLLVLPCLSLGQSEWRVLLYPLLVVLSGGIFRKSALLR